MTITLKLEACAAVGRPTGDVAYLRMPLALSAMDAMNRFVAKVYGKNCVCTEEPKGWLKVSTPPAPADTATGPIGKGAARLLGIDVEANAPAEARSGEPKGELT